MKIVAISDTHNRHSKLVIPECDILIHAGDYSSRGTVDEVRRFYTWLNLQPAKHKISVQGNHELGVQHDFENMKALALSLCPSVHFIEEGLVEVEGLKIWGSAYTPWFHNWAYNVVRFDEIKKHWDRIPEDTDILVTHGPPFGVLDELVRYNGEKTGNYAGCEELLLAVQRVRPAIHIFGHIHCGHGKLEQDGTTFYNVSICDEGYSASNPITVIEK